MCQALVKVGGVDLAFETISCDRLHRERPMQRGYCSSCILRRQALAVHGIKAQTCYIATARPVESQTFLRPKHAHLLAMLHQVRELRAILSPRSPWDSFVDTYPRLADVVDRTAPHINMAPEVMRERLIQLYRTYACEWDSDGVRTVSEKGCWVVRGYRVPRSRAER